MPLFCCAAIVEPDSTGQERSGLSAKAESHFSFTIAPHTAIEALRWPVALFTDSTNLAGY